MNESVKWLLAFLVALPAVVVAATLSWIPPTTNTDGSALTNLAGYRIYAGSCGMAKTTTYQVGPDQTNARVPNASCYQMTAFNSAGAESDLTVDVAVGLTPTVPTGVSVHVLADNTAYKMRQSVDGFEMVSIGTVAPGTACNGAHAVDDFYLVPRAAVTLASPFDTLPLLAFARCGS